MHSNVHDVFTTLPLKSKSHNEHDGVFVRPPLEELGLQLDLGLLANIRGVFWYFS